MFTSPPLEKPPQRIALSSRLIGHGVPGGPLLAAVLGVCWVYVCEIFCVLCVRVCVVCECAHVRDFVCVMLCDVFVGE